MFFFKHVPVIFQRWRKFDNRKQSLNAFSTLHTKIAIQSGIIWDNSFSFTIVCVDL